MSVEVSAKITANISVTHKTKDRPNDSGVCVQQFGRTDGYKVELKDTDIDGLYVYRGPTNIADPLVIDLSGTLEGPAGEEVAFTSIKGLLVVNHSNKPLGGEEATTDNVTVTGSWFDSIFGSGASDVIKPGEKRMYDFSNGGRPVVNSTADTIGFAPSAGTAYIDLIIIGETA